MFRLNQAQEHKAYVAEMQRYAKRQQLVHEALAGRRGRMAFYAPFMVGVGKKMMAWGCALQTRYAPMAQITFRASKRST